VAPDIHVQDIEGAQQLARIMDGKNHADRTTPLPVLPDGIHAPGNIHAFHATNLSQPIQTICMACCTMILS